MALLLLGCLLPSALAADTTAPLYERYGYESAEAYMEGEWSYINDAITYDWVNARLSKRYAEILAAPSVALESYGMESLADVDAGIESGWWDSRDDFYREVAMTMVYEDGYSYVPPLSVQLNVKNVAFPGAQPEVVGGRTMAPFRPLAEAMGFQVSYGANAVDATGNGTTIRFTLGQDTCLVRGKGENAFRTISMDAAAYMKNGTTYVPVRFFAKALGMTAAWDFSRNAVVVYDPAALTAAVDRQFTVVNKWLKSQSTQADGKAVRAAVSAALTYTELNSIDGNVVYPVSGTLEVVGQGASFQLSIQCDLYQLLRVVTEQDDSAALRQVEAMKSALKNASLGMIYDADADILYICCPTLVQVLSGYLAESVSPAAASLMSSAWIKVEGAVGSLASLTGMQDSAQLAGEVSVGAMILKLAEQSGEYMPSAIYGNTLAAGSGFAALFGDGAFKQNGTRYTVAFDETASYNGTDLEQLLDQLDMAYFKGNLLLDTASGAIQGDLECRTNEYYSDTLTKISVDATPAGGTVKLSVHENNTGILELTLRFDQQSGVAAPAKQPPEGSLVLDLQTLLGGVPEIENAA